MSCSPLRHLLLLTLGPFVALGVSLSMAAFMGFTLDPAGPDRPLAADPADANHLLAVAQTGEIWESGEGGKTWPALSP